MFEHVYKTETGVFVFVSVGVSVATTSWSTTSSVLVRHTVVQAFVLLASNGSLLLTL